MDTSSPRQHLICESEECYRALFEHSMDAVLLTAPDGRVFAANPAAVRMFGYSEEEFRRLGRDGVVDRSDPRLTAALEERARTGKVSCEVTLRRKDGTRFEGAITSSVFHDSSGEAMTAMFIQDVTERKRAEAERERLLKEVEQQRRLLQTVIDHAPAGIAVLRGPDFVFEMVNPAYQAIAPGKVLLGRSVAETWPELADQVVPLLDRVLGTGEPFHGTDLPLPVQRTPSGPVEQAYFTFIYLLMSRDSGEESRILVLVLETTEQVLARRRVEELARVAEGNVAQLAAVVDSITEGLVISDLHGNTVTVNREMLGLLGYTSLEEAPKRLPEFAGAFELRSLDGQQVPVEEFPLARVLRGETLSDLEVRVRNLRTRRVGVWSYSGRLVLDRAGRAILALLTVQDVTARREAEAALRQSEERYRTTVEVIDDSISVKDLEGRFMAVNAEFLLRTGKRMEEILGKTALEVYGPEASRKIMEDDRQAVTSMQVVDTEEFHPERKRARITHVRKAPLRDETGRVVGVITVSRDVTERKRMEEQLLRARRLEAAGQVAAQVAHDFNNLLSPLVAYPELLKMQLPPDHPAVAYCDSMQEAALRMADINENLMTLGRRGLLRKEPTDLNAVARDALKKMPALPDTLRVVAELDPNLPPVGGDPCQLLTMIVNLLRNARESMGEVGELEVRTENVSLERSLEGYSRIEPGEYVRLTVADTGSGIPDDIRGRIFDPFFTTRRSDKQRGSGLGLSIVEAIVADHGGSIDLETEVGKGSLFSIYLPVCGDAVEGGQDQEIPLGTEALLVVDDDQLQREVARALLRKLGYQVATVASGEEAVGHLRQRSVDLAILDMVMPPGIDGAETYRRMLEIRPDQRAIIVSGFSPSDRVEVAQALGAGPYLRKPVALEKLARAVRAELDRAR